MIKKHLFTVPLAGLLVGIIYFAVPFVPHAQAAGFTVNSLSDIVSSDVAPGDSICDDGAGNCTLRAAIEEVNALGGSGHVIDFNITGTITISSPLPTIASGVMMDATTAPGASCDMNSRNVPMEVDFNGFSGIASNVSDVTIRGFTLYNAQTGSPLSLCRGIIWNYPA